MVLDFNDIPEEGLTLERRLELREEGGSQGGQRVEGPVRFQARASRGRRGS